MNIIRNIDFQIITILHKLEIPIARLAIFIVYFWFGFLKLIGVSPAGEIVQSLFQRTIGFMSFSHFYILFAIFEMIIGIMFLIRKLERPAILLLGFHLITTAMPLFLLPHVTWQGFLVPTLEGQYIIKNILIIAVAITIGSELASLKNDSSIA